MVRYIDRTRYRKSYRDVVDFYKRFVKNYPFLPQHASLVPSFQDHETPVVAFVAPNSGASVGGVSITITGFNFANGATVKIGSTNNPCPATSVVFVSSTTLTCVTPVLSTGAGLKNVIVTNPNALTSGETGNNTFTYLGLPAPNVTGAFRVGAVSYIVTGLQDPSGGSDIQIGGTNFVTGCTVGFYQSAVLVNSATAVAFLNSSTIQATCPALASGIYDIVVTNPDAQTSGASGNGLHESYQISDDTWGCLLQPGAYDPDGLGAGVGRWTDSSGNGNHADSAGGGANPANNGAGCPLFDGSDDSLLINESFVPAVQVVAAMASHLNGTVVSFFESNAVDLDVIDYGNRAIICGIGASPGLYHTAGGLKSVAYDEISAYQVAQAGVYTSWDQASIKETHMAVMAWDASVDELRVRLDTGTMGTTIYLPDGIPNDSNTGASTKVGAGYSSFFYGTLKLIAITSAILTTSHLNKIREWGRIMNHIPASYFTPADDVNVYTWHKADTNVADIPSYLGGTVTVWNNHIAGDSTKNLVPVTVDPNFVQNDLYANFTHDILVGQGSELSSSYFASPLAQPYMIMCGVVQGSATIFDTIDPTGGPPRVASWTDGTNLYLDAGATLSVANPYSPFNTGQIFLFVCDGVTSEIYIDNSVTPVASGDAGTSSFSSLLLGNKYDMSDPAFQFCLMCEIVSSAGVPSATLRRQHMAYLAARMKTVISG